MPSTLEETDQPGQLVDAGFACRSSAAWAGTSAWNAGFPRGSNEIFLSLFKGSSLVSTQALSKRETLCMINLYKTRSKYNLFYHVLSSFSRFVSASFWEKCTFLRQNLCRIWQINRFFAVSPCKSQPGLSPSSRPGFRAASLGRFSCVFGLPPSNSHDRFLLSSHLLQRLNIVSCASPFPAN